MLNKNNSNNCL